MGKSASNHISLISIQVDVLRVMYKVQRGLSSGSGAQKAPKLKSSIANIVDIEGNTLQMLKTWKFYMK